ncbi:chromate transporter [Acidisoma sp. 7E03]
MTPSAPVPSRGDLFRTFLLIGAMGFGGVLPWARYMMVVRRRWMDEAAFTELLALGQFFPGPNVANCGVIYGRRIHGPMGSVLAVCGLYCVPMLVTLAAGLLIGRYWQNPAVQQVFGAVMPAASGLVLGTALRLTKSLPRRLGPFAVLALTFGLMALLHWPLWLVLLLCIPFSFLVSQEKRPRRVA